jgi:hypothetical protein
VFVTGANNNIVAAGVISLNSDEKIKVSSNDQSYHEANYPEESSGKVVQDLDSLTEE